MNPTLIAAIIAATAALTSATLSVVTAFRTKKQDFRNDYYKKLLDKRLSAYEKVERVVFNLRLTNISLTNSKLSYCQFFNNLEDFNGFITLIHSCLDSGLWLSSSCCLILRDLNDTLIIERDKYSSGGILDKSGFIKCGTEMFPSLERSKADLANDISSELAQMHNVQSFIQEMAA